MFSRQFEDEKPDDQQLRVKFADARHKGGSSDPKSIAHYRHSTNIGEFLKSIETGQRFCIDAREARKSVELITAIYKSAQTRMMVKLV